MPHNTTEIVSVGAKGVDTCAKNYAIKNKIRLKEFLPKYDKYPGRVAPIKRNDEIINYSDMVVAFWDGKSRGTKYVIEKCRELAVPCKVILINSEVAT